MSKAFRDDKPTEECGVFGIFAPEEDVARITFFGLYALQHRGQESAGIATSNSRTLYLKTGMGLVSQVFDEDDLAHEGISFTTGSDSEVIAQMLANAPGLDWKERWGHVMRRLNGAYSLAV